SSDISSNIHTYSSEPKSPEKIDEFLDLKTEDQSPNLISDTSISPKQNHVSGKEKCQSGAHCSTIEISVTKNHEKSSDQISDMSNESSIQDNDISINDLSPVSAQTIGYIFRKAIRSGQDTILHWYHFAGKYDRRIDEVSVSNKVGKKQATNLEVEKIRQVSYSANAISNFTYIQIQNIINYVNEQTSTFSIPLSHTSILEGAVKNDVKSLPEVRILPIDKNASEKSRLPISTLPKDPEEKRNLEFSSHFWERPETPFDILHNENTSTRRRSRNRTYDMPSIQSMSRRETVASGNNRDNGNNANDVDGDSGRCGWKFNDISMADAGGSIQPLEPINEEGS
ncbi:27398_t:CDS:2, partial [Gigaspora margarita]